MANTLARPARGAEAAEGEHGGGEARRSSGKQFRMKESEGEREKELATVIAIN
jgi:hypothetical protein